MWWKAQRWHRSPTCQPSSATGPSPSRPFRSPWSGPSTPVISCFAPLIFPLVPAIPCILNGQHMIVQDAFNMPNAACPAVACCNACSCAWKATADLLPATRTDQVLPGNEFGKAHSANPPRNLHCMVSRMRGCGRHVQECRGGGCLAAIDAKERDGGRSRPMGVADGAGEEPAFLVS